MFKSCGQKLGTGWEQENIYSMLDILLSIASHSKIRKEGFKLLMQYIINYDIPPKNYLDLYKSLVYLDVMPVNNNLSKETLMNYCFGILQNFNKESTRIGGRLSMINHIRNNLKTFKKKV
jgi:hypothetical protein